VKARRLIASLVFSLFFCEAALAVNLDNNDPKGYAVKIRSGASTLNSSINGNTRQVNVCSSCEIEVVGAGIAKVSGPVTVVIKGGRLSVRK